MSAFYPWKDLHIPAHSNILEEITTVSNFCNMTNDELSLFESIVRHPHQRHTGKTVNRLVGMGLVGESRGKYYAHQSIVDEWHRFTPDRPDDLDGYGPGVRVR